jgi:hypothetical protein
MGDIEHYNLLLIYHPGKLQTVPDALSRVPGVREEEEPVDIPRFFEIEDEDNISQENTPALRSLNIEHVGKALFITVPEMLKNGRS